MSVKIDFLGDLNEAQRAAVECTDGPSMVLAGAGSGKTRVLTYRIAYLIKKGVEPFSILSLTFTNKAAREMKGRITSLVGSEAKNLWMGTFHSVFARVLRAESEKIGYPKDFTIYDTEDSKALIKDILKEQGLDDKVYKPSLVLSRISAAKNSLISPQAYNDNSQVQEEDRLSGKPKIGLIYGLYSKRCFKSAAMDFDDLLYKTNILLRDFPDVLHKYQHRFRYILVDEYQDTNYSQYVIIKQLAAMHENVCVVGDDSQSIYAFRGANIQNIFNFEKDYPDRAIFKLEQNYRSTKNIVEAANVVIANNRERLQKEVWTHNDEGDKIKVMRGNTDNEEGMIVAGAIFETKSNRQANNRDFAILYRTNAQSRAMEEALRKLNIPYRIYGGLSFYQRKEVKDMLAYFRLAINNHDEESLKRIINYPGRGIGQTTVEKLVVAANDHNVSVWTVIENLQDFNLGINSGATAKLKDFATMIKSFSAMLPSQNAYDTGNHIGIATGLVRELYADKTPEGISRYDNIQELLNGLKEFSEEGRREIELNAELGILNPEEVIAENPLRTLPEYMQDIALLTDADKRDETEQDKNRVSLMTIHAAKGLEFPYVFIVGLEENLFPSQLSLSSRADLEEERRLFYVAITRAEKAAVLSYASTRYKWGNLVSCEPSRFIEEIDAQYLDFGQLLKGRQPLQQGRGEVFFRQSETFVKSGSNKAAAAATGTNKKHLVRLKTAANSVQTNYDNSHLKDLKIGMDVEHERFGPGKVVGLEGEFPNTKATVDFPGTGQKQLLLKFARLKIVG